MEKNCFYCGHKFVVSKNAKGDHVIPDALGSNKTFKNVCPKCNTKFNTTIDNPVITSLTPFIMLFQIHSKKGTADSKMNFEHFHYIDSENDISTSMKAQITNSGEVLTPTQKLNDNVLFVNTATEAAKRKDFCGDIKVRNKEAFVSGTSSCSPPHPLIQKKFDIKAFLNLIGASQGIDFLNSLNLDVAKKFVIEDTICDYDCELKPFHKPIDSERTKQPYHRISVYTQDSNLIGEISLFSDWYYRKYVLAKDITQSFDRIEEIIYIPIHN